MAASTVSVEGCWLLQMANRTERVGELSDDELASLLAEGVLAEMSVSDPKA